MIFNNVSSSEFFPLDKQLARTVLQIDTPKKIILAGAQKITDPYKGFDRFLDAVSRLSPSDYFIVFFGRIPGEEAAKTGLEYRSFGFVHDTVTLRLLYSAADIFVAPSLMDAFGKTLVESLACGTPVVCFDATGPKTIVDHKQNGYKAVPYDPEDLRRGIEGLPLDITPACKAEKSYTNMTPDYAAVSIAYLEILTEEQTLIFSFSYSIPDQHNQRTNT